MENMDNKEEINCVFCEMSAVVESAKGYEIEVINDSPIRSGYEWILDEEYIAYSCPNCGIFKYMKAILNDILTLSLEEKRKIACVLAHLHLSTRKSLIVGPYFCSEYRNIDQYTIEDLLRLWPECNQPENMAAVTA